MTIAVGTRLGRFSTHTSIELYQFPIWSDKRRTVRGRLNKDVVLISNFKDQQWSRNLHLGPRRLRGVATAKEKSGCSSLEKQPLNYWRSRRDSNPRPPT